MTGVFLGAASAACFFFLLSADAVKGTARVKANSNTIAISACAEPIDFLRTSNILKNLQLLATAWSSLYGRGGRMPGYWPDRSPAGRAGPTNGAGGRSGNLFWGV